MANDPRILALLRRWRQARNAGHPILAAELCADCPELAAALETQITHVVRLERRLTHWKALRAEGRTATPEELCRGRPELVEPLRRLMHAWEQRYRPPPAEPPPTAHLPAAPARRVPRSVRLVVAAVVAVAVLGPWLAWKSLSPAQPAHLGEPPPTAAEAGSEPRCLRGHDADLTAVALSPDGRWLLSASVDGVIRLWQVPTGTTRRVWPKQDAAVTCVTFSAPVGRLLIATEDGRLELWDRDQDEPLQRFQLRGSGGVREVRAAADGRRALSRGADGTVFLWDLDRGELLEHLAPQRHRPLGLHFAAADRPCVLRQETTADGVAAPLVLWDLKARQVRARYGTLDARGHAAVTPDGTGVLTWSAQGVALWDLADGKPRARRAASVSGASASADGQLVVTWHASGTCDLWDLPADAHLRRLEGHDGAVTCAALAADGSLAVTGGKDHTVRLWPLTEVRRPPATAPGPERVGLPQPAVK